MRISSVSMMSAVAAVAMAGVASAAIDFTGDPTTSSGLSWSSLGNSLQTSNVIWAGGNTIRSVGFYSSNFIFTGSETQSASMGNNSVSGAGWNVGDRVVAIGWQVTNGATAGAGWLNGETFMKFNPGGAGGYQAASSVGGSGSSTSFSNSVAGDYQLYGTGNGTPSNTSGNEGEITVFRYRTSDPGYVTTYPMQVGAVSSGALLANPFRSFSVLAGGTAAPGGSQISSQTFLVNVDLLARAGADYGFSPNMIGNTIGKLMIDIGQGAGSVSTTVVLTDVPVPAPGAIALLGLAGLAGGRRRRS